MKGGLHEKFEVMMEKEESRKLFHNYLRSIMSEEHFEFYLESNDYEKTKDPMQRKEIGTRIFNMYLSPCCCKPLNVSSDIKNAVTSNFSSGLFDEKLYTECRNVVGKMLVMDSLPRYLNTNKNGLSEKPFGRPKLNSVGGGEVKRKVVSLKPDNEKRRRRLSRKKSGDKKDSKRKSSRKSKSMERRGSKMVENTPRLDDAWGDSITKKKFYDYLVKIYSNEYHDFLEEVSLYEKSSFENEKSRRDSVDRISRKYLGIGEGSEYLLGFSSDIMKEFKQKLSTNCLNEIFHPMMRATKDVLKSQFISFQSSEL